MLCCSGACRWGPCIGGPRMRASFCNGTRLRAQTDALKQRLRSTKVPTLNTGVHQQRNYSDKGQEGTMSNILREKLDAESKAREQDIRTRLEKGEKGFPKYNSNVFLRECTEEVEVPLSGVQTGEIPSWISGTLIRNGPGKQTFGTSKFRHLFDGSSLLHRFEIKDGEVTYQCKFLQSDVYKANSAAQRIVVSEFGTNAVPDPCQSVFQRFASMFQSSKSSDNCNISVFPLDDEVYVYGEVPSIHRIDPTSLNSLRKVNAFKMVNIVHHTSHPHVTQDGTVYNVGLAVANKTQYSVVAFPKTKRGSREGDEDVFADAQIVARVPSRWPLNPGYMHSFGLTDNYFVIIEQPFCISVPTMWTLKFTGATADTMLKWYEGEQTLLHVVSRETGALVKTFGADPFFYFHTINQYEEDGHIVLDLCAFKDGAIVTTLLYDSLSGAQNDADFAKKFRARPVRFVLPMKDDDDSENLVKLKESKAKAWRARDSPQVQVSPELLADISCELPRVNYPKYLGKKYKYFYGTTLDIDGRYPGGVIKVDTETKTNKVWFEDNRFASEPMFVPAPNAKDEDDGVILTSLLSTGNNEESKVTLLVLDGKTFEEIGRTVFDTPSPVPSTFHGWFFTGQDNLAG